MFISLTLVADNLKSGNEAKAPKGACCNGYLDLLLDFQYVLFMYRFKLFMHLKKLYMSLLVGIKHFFKEN